MNHNDACRCAFCVIPVPKTHRDNADVVAAIHAMGQRYEAALAETEARLLAHIETLKPRKKAP